MMVFPLVGSSFAEPTSETELYDFPKDAPKSPDFTECAGRLRPCESPLLRELP